MIEVVWIVTCNFVGGYQRSTRLHGFTTQETRVGIDTAERTADVSFCDQHNNFRFLELAERYGVTST